MKINVTLDLADFCSEFEGLDDWARSEVKDMIIDEIKKDPRWKEYIKSQANKAIEAALATGSLTAAEKKEREGMP
jgi:hypothetical protein